jgi:hypothetical protein
MAASKGARLSFPYGNTRNWPGWTRRQTPAEMFSSVGRNHASPWVWGCEKCKRNGDGYGRETNLFEYVVEEGVVGVVIHCLGRGGVIDVKGLQLLWAWQD